jgi:hypothetical protein
MFIVLALVFLDPLHLLSRIVAPIAAAFINLIL